MADGNSVGEADHMYLQFARKASDSTVWDAATREFFEVTGGETGETMDGRELPFEFRVCCVARRLVVKLLCRLHARSLSRM